MKKLLVTCVIVTIGFGLCSTVTANPTTTETTSGQSVTTKGDKDDSSFFLQDWLRWLLEHLFGYDYDDGKPVYTSSSSGSSYDPGDGGSGYDPGGGGWDYEPGGGGWDSGSGSGSGGSSSGDGGWGSNPGNGGWGGDTGTTPVQPIPAPGAFLLGGIGVSCISWLRRRKTL